MVMTFILTTSYMTDLVLDSKKESAINQYGKFNCAVRNINKNELDQLNNLEGFDKGHFQLQNKISEDNLAITLGNADQKFFELASIKLIKGEYPNSNTEYVMEAFLYEKYFNELKFPFIYNTGKEDLIITGIINNYSQNMPVSTEYQKGVNDFPNIISIGMDSNLKYNVLLCKKNLFKYDSNQMYAEIQQKLENIGIYTDRFDDNTKLFHYGISEYHDLYTTKAIYLIVIFILTLIISFASIRVYYVKYRYNFTVLITYGMTKREIFKVLFLQNLYLFSVSIIFAIVIGFIGCNYLINPFFHIDNFSGGIFIKALFVSILWIVLNFVVAMVYIICVQKNINMEKITYNLNNVVKIKKKNQVDNIFVNKKNRWNLIGLYVILLFFIAASIWFVEKHTINYGEFPEYQLFSKEASSMEVKNNYCVLNNTDNYITYDSIKQIEEYKDFLINDKYLNADGASILIDKDAINTYFLDWILKYRSDNAIGDKSTLDRNWPREADEYSYVPNVNFIAVDDMQLQRLISRYKLNIIDINGFKEENKVLLFLPGYKIEGMGDFMENDTINIGGIKRMDNTIRFNKESVKVVEIINKSFVNEYYGYEEELGGITVVVHEDIVLDSSVFNGFSNVNIYLDKTTPNEISSKIDNIMNQINATMQGSVLYSIQHWYEYDTIIRKFVAVMGVTLSIYAIISIVLFITMSVYIDIIRNQYKYGIGRAFGMSMRQLFSSVFIQYMKSLSYAVVITFLLLKPLINSDQDWINFLPVYIVISSIVLTITIICKYISIHRYLHISINDMLREKV